MRIYILPLLMTSLMILPLRGHAEDTYKYTRSVSSPVTKSIPLVADVSPKQASEVQSPRDGVIKEIFAWPGDTVGKNTPLLRLDDSALQEQKRKLDAERTEYTAHLRRIEKLVERELVDSKIWDNNLQKLAQVRAELAIVEEKIEKSLVLAPERGTVLWSDLKTGQTIEGAAPIYWIGDGDNLWLSAYLEEDLSAGLKEQDVVAIFTENSSDPVLGNIDFISFGGPKGGDINLYINAPRIGEIARNKKQNILIPLPSDAPEVILPENALTADNHVFALTALGADTPNKFFLTKSPIDILRRENGVVYLKNAPEGVAVLLDPAPTLKHRDVVTAFEDTDHNWGDEFAALILAKDNTSTCAANGGGGSCSGGTACGGGVATEYSEGDPEKKACLVASAIFDRPNEGGSANEQPEIPTMASPQMDMNNLPASVPGA